MALFSYLCTQKRLTNNYWIMAEYKIECEQFLGMSHSGPVTTAL